VPSVVLLCSQVVLGDNTLVEKQKKSSPVSFEALIRNYIEGSVSGYGLMIYYFSIHKKTSGGWPFVSLDNLPPEWYPKQDFLMIFLNEEPA
jgi:hypothetical protein